MNLFKQNLAKNLILLIIIVALASLSNLVWVNKALAAYGLDLKIRQVKTADNPAVYYLDHRLGVKKAYLSEAAFLSYGNKWSGIKIISQAQLDKWPDLKLVKLAGEKNIYYIKGNKKTLIKSPTDLLSFGFNFGQVATIQRADFSSYQIADYAAVGLRPAASQTLARAGGGSPGLLTIELDPNRAKSGFLPMNSRHNLVGVFNFKAGNSPVEIKQITFNLGGVFKPEVVEKVTLANEADYALAEPVELNNRQAVFNFGINPLIMAAGENKKIKVYIDLKSYTDFTNHAIKVSLNSPKASQANVDISGNFPITTGEYKLVLGTLMGQAQAEEIALKAGNKLIIGANEKIIGKFKINETSNKESMTIKKITLVNRGTARSTDLINFKLRDSNNNLAAQSLGLEDDTIVFNLNNYQLNKGQHMTFLLLADVIGGENKTVNFNWRDLFASGDIYGYGLAFSQIDNNETYTISRESLNVLSLDLNPSQRVFSKQSGVLLGNFQVRNNNQKVRLVNLSVSLEKSAGAPALSEAVYLVNYDSGEVYSVGDGSKIPGGINLSFNDLALEPRQVLDFSLITNVPSDCQSGAKYRAIINKIIYRYDNSSFFEDDLGLPGAYLTVTKSSLYVYPNNSAGWDRNYIKGQKDIKIASFILEAAAGDDVIINQITLAKSGDTSGSVLYDNGFSNLRLYIGNSQIGLAINRPSLSSYVFDNFNYRFAASGRAELRLYVDTERDLKASEAQLIVASIGAKSGNSGVPSAISGLNSTSRKAHFGDSRAEVKVINGGSFAPGVNDNQVGRFSIANNGAEEIGLDSLNIFTTSDGFSNSLGFSDLTIIEASQLNVVGRVSRPVAGANLIGLGGWTIKPSQTVEFTIRVSADETAPENVFEIYLSDLAARGRKSGLDVIVSGDPTNKVAVNNTSFDNNESDNNQDSAIKLAWPVDSRRINYGFHDPSYPFRSTAEHDGADIDVDQGTPVKAAANGVVADVKDNQTAQYNYVIIDHGNSLETVYGHLSEIDVKLGDAVTSGQVIGLSGGLPGSIGSGPNTNGPHLHFGVIQNGAAVDPRGFLK